MRYLLLFLLPACQPQEPYFQIRQKKDIFTDYVIQCDSFKFVSPNEVHFWTNGTHSVFHSNEPIYVEKVNK